MYTEKEITKLILVELEKIRLRKAELNGRSTVRELALARKHKQAAAARGMPETTIIHADGTRERLDPELRSSWSPEAERLERRWEAMETARKRNGIR